ncbi:MAG TPA: multiheme c-type cytochrome [Terriglobia bacterium]|nr:multiheme c-type cytochrome [Terriglobia bacterium]
MNPGYPDQDARPSPKSNGGRWAEHAREWHSRLAIAVAGLLGFLTLSGLSIWLLPFSVANQVTVFAHTLLGLAFLVPAAWYLVRHWRRYWRDPLSHLQLLGYIGAAVLLLCLVSGGVLTYEAAVHTRIRYGWDTLHIVTTLAILAFVLPHILLVVLRDRRGSAASDNVVVTRAAGRYGQGALVLAIVCVALVAVAWFAYNTPRLRNRFPSDYSYKYGKDRPFAPSLARTSTGGAMDDRLLSGSASCGTSGCHQQIVEEWQSSAHRYSAMDAGFQKVQMNMAQQNGPESTRYCGGCHDPISLFSGTKNLFVATEKLTSLHGYQEGISCLACHSIRKVDLKGNANYVVVQPTRYMFELDYDQNPRPATRFLRDFIIRAYPRQHVKDLSKTLFKTPEYCAACHKQFIDQEINNVGWVQLQNQYDNWRQSRWNHPGDPRKTIECRECHMPLVASTDPAAGDASDYNRTPNDGKHRSHRFVAANQFMPAVLKLPGWQKQLELTDRWLTGQYDIPEIADKWAHGPAVGMELVTPDEVRPGEKVDVKLVLTSNKVGHDFPTGPLDIIQAWVELIVTDDHGNVVMQTGTVNAKGFIQPGTFMFKAEPVDQNGNLIDRHNLWEMVGVRYRRSLFPGFSDTADFSFWCPQLAPVRTKKFPQQLSYDIKVPGKSAGQLHVTARLCYRKIDQFLLNFLFGEKAGLTSPVTAMTSQSRDIKVVGGEAPAPERTRAQRPETAPVRTRTP